MDLLIEHVTHKHGAHLINNNDVLKPHQKISTGVFLKHDSCVFIIRRVLTVKNEFLSWSAELISVSTPIKKYVATIRIVTADGNVHVLRQPCSVQSANVKNEPIQPLFYMLKSSIKGCTVQISISETNALM